MTAVPLGRIFRRPCIRHSDSSAPATAKMHAGLQDWKNSAGPSLTRAVGASQSARAPAVRTDTERGRSVAAIYTSSCTWRQRDCTLLYGRVAVICMGGWGPRRASIRDVEGLAAGSAAPFISMERN